MNCGTAISPKVEGDTNFPEVVANILVVLEAMVWAPQETMEGHPESVYDYQKVRTQRAGMGCRTALVPVGSAGESGTVHRLGWCW